MEGAPAATTRSQFQNMFHLDTISNNAQCALWAVQWPCSILAIAVKKTFSWENNIFELLCYARLGRKLEIAFYFPALKA